MKGDPKLVVIAAAQAQKAAEFILGIQHEEASEHRNVPGVGERLGGRRESEQNCRCEAPPDAGRLVGVRSDELEGRGRKE